MSRCPEQGGRLKAKQDQTSWNEWIAQDRFERLECQHEVDISLFAKDSLSRTWMDFNIVAAWIDGERFKSLEVQGNGFCRPSCAAMRLATLNHYLSK
jgi:hypothetical protein